MLQYLKQHVSIICTSSVLEYLILLNSIEIMFFRFKLLSFVKHKELPKYKKDKKEKNNDKELNWNVIKFLKLLKNSDLSLNFLSFFVL